jgi:hypothetical protein
MEAAIGNEIRRTIPIQGIYAMSAMTEEQLNERLQRLWVQATASCGSATPQLVEEIRDLERQLENMRAKDQTEV